MESIHHNRFRPIDLLPSAQSRFETQRLTGAAPHQPLNCCVSRNLLHQPQRPVVQLSKLERQELM